MLCWGREKGLVTKEQRWDFITLSDFKTRSCWTVVSYIWLWVLIITSCAVIAVDIFTAVNLLAFNQWASEVQPKIPFEVGKWIFASCIIVSFVILGFEWVRAIGVIKRGSIAESYLDPLAVILQSIRVDKDGHGYKRFLVFAELTKNKKGIDYVALFVYFQFKGAIMLLIAEGPRIVINSFTLFAVLTAELIPDDDEAKEAERSNFDQFWENVKVLYEKNNKQAIILISMLFTLVIWVIFTIMLIIAVILYVLFVWRHIPASDGRLSKYCRRKVDARLDEIVSVTIRKALSKEEAKSQKEMQKQKGTANADRKREPTLPRMSRFHSKYEPSVHSVESQSTLPPYISRIGTAQSFAGSDEEAPPVPSLHNLPRPGLLARSGTYSSEGSDASLLHQAADMGQSEDPRLVAAGGSSTPFSQNPSHVWPGPPPYNNSGRSTPIGQFVRAESPFGQPLTGRPASPAGQPDRTASPLGQPYTGRSASPAGQPARTASPFGQPYVGRSASPAPSLRNNPFPPALRTYNNSPLNNENHGRASPAMDHRVPPSRPTPHVQPSYAMEPIPRSYTPSQPHQFTAFSPVASPQALPQSSAHQYTHQEQQPRPQHKPLPRLDPFSDSHHSSNRSVGSLASSPPPISPVNQAYVLDAGAPATGTAATGPATNNFSGGLTVQAPSARASRRSSFGDLLDSYGDRN